MRTSNSFFHGLLPLMLLLLSIVAATIFFTASSSELTVVHGAHPRSHQSDLIISVNGSEILETRAPGNTIVRPASEEVCAKAWNKGYTLMCWMQNPQMAGAQAFSPFTRFEQLADWGWTGQGGQPIHIGGNWGTYADPGLMALLGHPMYGQSTGHEIRIYHTQARGPIVVGGRQITYPATMASYDNIFVADKGVIIAASNWGPASKLAEGITGWDYNANRLPDLRQLSDIWWLLWEKVCSQQRVRPSELRYIVSKDTVNQETNEIFARILQMYWPNDEGIARGIAPKWPGKRITKEMDGFPTLVGTPSVWGAAYMLIQRAGTMGRKEIKSITVWNENENVQHFYQPSIMIEVGDV
ncbi:unnamed protein product [Cercospora beticola]|nr:unnamed protein product [Cercospora beticola]